MTDDQIRHELERLSQRVRREPPDVGELLRSGHRRLRLRRAGLAVSGVAGATVVALAASALAGGPATDPGPANATGAVTPSLHPSTAPQVTASQSTSATATTLPPTGGDVAIDDRGGTPDGFGFGVAVDSMVAATDGAGNLTFQPITLEQATASCWPMLEQVLPGSSAEDWRITNPDDFPSHATTYVQWVAADDAYATCVMPGGPVPIDGPLAPTGTDPDELRAACSALADIDLTGFSIEATASASGTTAVSLRSANDHLVRCVLSPDPAVRTLQVHRDQIASFPPLESIGLLYGEYWTTTFTSTGYAGPDIDRLVITIAGAETNVDVVDGFYAVVIPLETPLSTDDDFRARALDEAGAVQWEGDWEDFGLYPSECLTSYEEEHGC